MKRRIETIKIEIFECEFCGKSFEGDLAEGFCKGHEDHCLENPKNKFCTNCAFSEIFPIRCKKGIDNSLIYFKNDSKCEKWEKRK